MLLTVSKQGLNHQRSGYWKTPPLSHGNPKYDEAEALQSWNTETVNMLSNNTPTTLCPLTSVTCSVFVVYFCYGDHNTSSWNCWGEKTVDSCFFQWCHSAQLHMGQRMNVLKWTELQNCLPTVSIFITCCQLSVSFFHFFFFICQSQIILRVVRQVVVASTGQISAQNDTWFHLWVILCSMRLQSRQRNHFIVVNRCFLIRPSPSFLSNTLMSGSWCGGLLHHVWFSQAAVHVNNTLGRSVFSSSTISLLLNSEPFIIEVGGGHCGQESPGSTASPKQWHHLCRTGRRWGLAARSPDAPQFPCIS